MLTVLTRTRRFRAARLLAALYALCVLAPTAAFAFGDGSKAADCVTSVNHGLAKVHVHADGKGHHHGTSQQNSDAGDDEKYHSPSCCGLACLTGMISAVDLPWSDAARAPQPSLLAAVNIHGYAPDRLDRPPRSLASD